MNAGRGQRATGSGGWKSPNGPAGAASVQRTSVILDPSLDRYHAPRRSCALPLHRNE